MTGCDILCDRVPLFFASLRRLSSHRLEPRVCRVFAFEAVGPWVKVYVSPRKAMLSLSSHKWVPLARVPPAPPVVRRCPGSWWAFVVDGHCPQQGFGFAVDGPMWGVLTGFVLGMNMDCPSQEEVLTGILIAATRPFDMKVLTGA